MADNHQIETRTVSTGIAWQSGGVAAGSVLVFAGAIGALYPTLVSGPLIGGAVVAAMTAGSMGWMIVKRALQPLQSLSQQLELVASGRPINSIPETARPDEFGSIARSATALNAGQFSNSLSRTEHKSFIEDLTHALTQLERGRAEQRLTGDYAQDYQTATDAFNKAMVALSDVLGAITSYASAIKVNAESVGTTTRQLSQRSETQAATLEQSSAAIEELASSVVLAAEGAQRAEQLVTNAKSNAESSGQVMDQAVAAMKKIETSSTQISQVVGLIDDIAFQTNLLALNASVEAARAGDAGRGFAVVASEVRALAQRSSDAAKEIESLIGESEAHVSFGVQHVHQAVDTLRNIASSVTEISSAVSEIAGSTHEQSLTISEINTAISSLDQSTQQNATMVSDVANAGSDLSEKASELNRCLAAFSTTAVSPTVAAPATTIHAPATRNTVAAQQARVEHSLVEHSFRAQGSAAIKVAEPVADDWVEF